jgi:hypothetical protein
VTRERIGLVGCVKSKRRSAAPAADLYTSALFVGRRRWVVETCDRWFILSAKYGLLDPGQVIEPYDESLTQMGRPARREWSRRVVEDLQHRLGVLDRYEFELHAGSAYSEYGLRDALVTAGSGVAAPAEHLRQGEQLALYRDGPGLRAMP